MPKTKYHVTIEVIDNRGVLDGLEFSPFPAQVLKQHGVLVPIGGRGARRTPGVSIGDTVEVEREPVYDVWPFEDPAKYWQQTDYWTDAAGRQNPIEHMSLDYIANVLHMLTREKHKLHGAVPSGWGYAEWQPDTTPLAVKLRKRLVSASVGAVQTPVPADAYSRA
jgi:hypothetical protein